MSTVLPSTLDRWLITSCTRFHHIFFDIILVIIIIYSQQHLNCILAVITEFFQIVKCDRFIPDKFRDNIDHFGTAHTNRYPYPVPVIFDPVNQCPKLRGWIFSTAENRVVGAEALARLIDPEIGNIPPDEFIHVAERSGEIMELGRQIFEHVCSFIQSASLRERGIEFINVNLSPAQCMNAQLTAEFSAIAQRYQVPMDMIDFEITESTADDAHELQTQLIHLQKSGAELSIDDFGTGTSNLTRLTKLPIHVVKLDMSIAWAHFSGETTILPDLVRMFKNAGLKVVVEGVETAEMKESLTEMGCDYLQGYYFSAPIPAEDFDKKFIPDKIA